MKTFKDFTLFMAFLMFLTSCYTWKEVQTSEKYDLKEKDHVKLIAQGREYKNAKVKSVTDSTVIIVDFGYGYKIKKDDISYLKRREHMFVSGNNGETHNTSFVVIFYWIFLFR